MAKDWTKIYEKYKGLWVALLEDETTVVGSGRKLEEALKQAKRQGHTDPIVMRVPNTLAAYVGNSKV
ncbi:MAG: DUF5678 domain-containing protein [Patescibacteria group bacterium]